jgi:phosphoheptose isomerase
MDYYATIAGNFQDTVETVTLSVDALAGPIAAASERMTACLLADGTLFVCGNGADAALAQLFAGSLLGLYQRERPALPAVPLCADGAGLTAVARAGGPLDIYARQLRALAREGDLLLCINSGAGDAALARAMDTARERNMSVVLLSNATAEGLSATAADVQVLVEARHAPRVIEVQLMILNCLCDLIDRGLFGSYEEQ